MMSRNLQAICALSVMVAGTATAATTSDSMDNLAARLTEYVRKHGGFVHPDVKISGTHHGGATVRGIISTAAIANDTVFLRIPTSSMLRNTSFPTFMAKDLSVHKSCREYFSKKKLPIASFFMGAAMAVEKIKGNTSAYAPLIEMLPDVKMIFPHFAQPAVLDDFEEFFVAIPPLSKIQPDQQLRRKCFKAWQNTDKDVTGVQLEDLENFAFSHASRAFTFEDSISMLPYGDLLNTGPSDAVNAVYGHFPGEVVFKTTSPLAKGSEIIAPYCSNCNNLELLVAYGVYLEGNQNRIESNSYRSSWCTDEKVHSKTFKILESADSSRIAVPGQTAPRCKGTDGKQKSLRGTLQCSIARIAWEYCGCTWNGKACPGENVWM